ncbi:MAG: hypothetical protein ACRD5D_09380 [Candidatus Polarisedimenticolia bacterium]
MKRTLTALALTGLMLGANVAVASQNDFTLEPFWQRSETTSVAAAEDTQATTQSRKYEQVDGYNN